MAIFLNMGVWNSVFAVPYELIQKHLKLCGKNELKFILWVFANPNKSIESKTLCAETGINEVFFDDCLEYWIDAGLLKKDGEVLSANTPNENTEKEQIPTQEAVLSTVKEKPKKMLRPDSFYIAKRIGESKDLENLFQEVQILLGKTISPALSAVLIISHDDYLLPCDVILMLISYCLSIDKISTSQIENMAKNWYETGVTNLELAEQKLRELDSINEAWNRFYKTIGLPKRNPIKTELEVATLAINELRFSDEMIKFCYEKCIENTGKYSAKYMKKIFESWQSKNFKTIDQVMSQPQKSNDNTSNSSSNVYDFNKLNVFNLDE